MNRRALVLTLALVATLAATAWTAYQEQKEPSDLVEPVVRGQATDRPVVEVRNPQAMQHTALNEASRDAFAPRDWTPPPPPPPKALPPPPPPPPMAPPLPYRYLGKWREDGRLVVFLKSGNNSILVKGGEVLDGQWKVDEIAPRMMRFTYLPLAQTTTLNIGDAL